ncbi:hypothetical protein [Mesomycoplasma neurolyticum]|uniref:Uncharacterized protein n=1 Tax=Mesomycoplasma neurolyticum TaxID=2120 RepID=A0A449A5H6_9BACT|nr:hypothetical protein [Mesomycoplasma neurolyticum]VEU59403.1 Uncharacterised protein [Mesomycoplasma neurolyticum]
MKKNKKNVLINSAILLTAATSVVGLAYATNSTKVENKTWNNSNDIKHSTNFRNTMNLSSVTTSDTTTDNFPGSYEWLPTFNLSGKKGNFDDNSRFDKTKPNFYVERSFGVVGFQDFQQIIDFAQSNETIYLNQNVKIHQSILINKNVTISSKDKVHIVRNIEDEAISMFTVKGSATLTFEVNDPEKEAISLNGLGVNLKGRAPLISVERNAKLVAKKGINFYNAKTLNGGPAVFENKGEIIIDGSNIEHNVSSGPTIIKNYDHSTFELKSGIIFNNATMGEAGIFENEGILKISGGLIDFNKSFTTSLIISKNDSQIYLSDGIFRKNLGYNKQLFEMRDNSMLFLEKNAYLVPSKDIDAIVLRDDATIKILDNLNTMNEKWGEQGKIRILVDIINNGNLKPKNLVLLNDFHFWKERIFDYFVFKNFYDDGQIAVLGNQYDNTYKIWPDLNLFKDFREKLNKDFTAAMKENKVVDQEEWVENYIGSWFDGFGATSKLIFSKILQLKPRNWKIDTHDWYESDRNANNKFNELLYYLHGADIEHVFEIAYSEVLKGGKPNISISYHQGHPNGLIGRKLANPYPEVLKWYDISKIRNMLQKHIINQREKYDKGYITSDFLFKKQITSFLVDNELLNVLYKPGGKAPKVENILNETKNFDFFDYSAFWNNDNNTNRTTILNENINNGIFIIKDNNVQKFATLEKAIEAAQNNDTIYLNDNVELEKKITIRKKIKFSSHKKINITRKYDAMSYDMFEISKGGALTVELDNPKNQSITFNGLSIDLASAALISVNSGGEFYAGKGVSFLNAKSTNSDFSVFRNNGKIEINGSQFLNNHARKAAIVNNYQSGTFIFRDGLIANNLAEDIGSLIESYGILKILGGKIMNNDTKKDSLISAYNDFEFNGNIGFNTSTNLTAIHLFNDAKLTILKDAYIDYSFAKHIILENRSSMIIKEHLDRINNQKHILNVILREQSAENLIFEIKNKELDVKKVATEILDKFRFVDDIKSKAVILEAESLVPVFRVASKTFISVMENFVLEHKDAINDLILKADEKGLMDYISKSEVSFRDVYYTVKQFIKYTPYQIWTDKTIEGIKASEKTIEDFANELWTISERAFIFAGLASAMAVGYGVAAFFTAGSTTWSAIGSAIQATTLYIQGGLVRKQYSTLVNMKDWDQIKKISFSQLSGQGAAAIKAVSRSMIVIPKMIAVYRAVKSVGTILSASAAATSWSSPFVAVLFATIDLVISSASFMDGLVY